MSTLMKSDATTLQFLVIIDKKNFGGEKDGELKSCGAGSLNGQSSKLFEGIVYFIIRVSPLTVISKITVYKVKKSGISLDNVPGTVKHMTNLKQCFFV